MSDKPVAIIISDLHLGGGASDPGDDHVFGKNQLQNFIQEELWQSPEGQRGEIELFINGDFFEFAQAQPSAYTLASAKAWCSVDESEEKLKAILDGHAGVFKALEHFGNQGNLVTMAAGNHDVDLFWPAVRQKICEKAGKNVQFILGEAWSSRFEGKLRISHGHQEDRGNKFQKWSKPFVTGPDGKERLEMCPGTLFMVKFLNLLERDYPFADNIKPIGALARIIIRGDTLGAMAAAWMLGKFCASHPQSTLEIGPSGTGGPDFPRLLVDAARANNQLGDRLRKWYRSYFSSTVENAAVEEALLDEGTLKELLLQVMLHEKPLEWKEAMDPVSLGGSTLGDEEGTLELALSRIKDDKELFREVAQNELSKEEVQIVVLGHTHIPDLVEIGDKKYFNPGSWTRYADIGAQRKLTLDDLRDESRFPYQLNYVRVDRDGPNIRGSLVTYSEFPGFWGKRPGGLA